MHEFAGKIRAMKEAQREDRRLDLIEAMAVLRGGRRLEAESLLRSAVARGDRDARVEAAFLLTVVRKEQGTLSPEAALRELLGQRFLGRGHLLP